ncbi:MAG: hypothetical protein Q7S92_02165 [Candidatus Diapherotrites archaeon]|nr:hypothetical protein [Candidatus Diapherotrites archaeon]
MEKSHNLRLRYSNKGYALILDAVLAMIIFISLYTLLANYSFNEKNSLGTINVQKRINDTLDLLDERNALESLNADLLTRLINSSLPANWKWKLTLKEYTFSENQFSLVSEQKLGNTFNSNTGKQNKGRRMFLTFKDGKIYRYYLAELETELQ